MLKQLLGTKKCHPPHTPGSLVLRTQARPQSIRIRFLLSNHKRLATAATTTCKLLSVLKGKRFAENI